MTAPAIMLRSGSFFFKWRNQVFPLVAACLFIVFPPLLAGGSLATDAWLDVLGFVVAAAGQALRAAVIGFAYIKRGGLNKRIYAKDLVTSGLFGVSRNPLYLGNLLILLGLFTIEGNPLALAFGLGFFLFAYQSIVIAEEDFLSREFGSAYDGYARRVNRWWPSPGRLAEATRDMSFNWRRVIIKDYGTACGWIVAALVLLAYERAFQFGLSDARPSLLLLGALLIAVLTAALVIRRAKKSGRLIEDPA